MTRVTCPHCSRALHIPEMVTAEVVTCPRCLGGMPNPAASETGAATGSERVLAIDAEVNRDTRGIGWGIVLLTMLLMVGIAFLVSVAMGVTKTAGSYGENLLLVWLGAGGVGGILVLVLATISMTRHLFRRLPESGETSRAERRVLQGLAVMAALVIGVIAGVVVIGLTCGAIIGGGLLGGGLK